MVDPPLSDGTVTLSPFRPDEVSAHVAGQDELTARWLSGGVVTQHSAAAYFEHCRDQWATGGPLRAFAIRVGPQQVPAGTVDLRFAGEGLAFGEVNVAYGLYPAWRRRGLATRAVDLVCRYAAELDATVAVIKVEPENSASARVALRAGFGRTSRIRESDGNVFDRYERTLSKGVWVRIAGEADIDSVFEIRTSVTENHLSLEQLAELGITTESVREAMRASPCLWVADVDGVTAGFTMADATAGSVFACFVRPQFQGRGVGSALMRRVEATLFERHTEIWLTTDGSSRAAGFYRKLGWSAAGDLPDGSIRFEKRLRAPAAKMHADEVDIDASLVRRLVSTQFPHWADLPLTPIDSAGTDNALYRLGTDMAVRLPRIHWAVASLRTEQRWLGRIAPQLPVASPVPVGLGAAAQGFTWPWSICRWVTGENPKVGQLVDPIGLARDLADFIGALRRIDPAGGPDAARGKPLAEQDEQVRGALATLDGRLDVHAVTVAWERALRIPGYAGPPTWFHGDLSPFNILTVDGRLAGVIDFGLMGVGDPSVDLIPAWNLLSAPAREQFRTMLRVDAETWARGCGRALSIALVALPYYQTTNPQLAGSARHVISEILADQRRSGSLGSW